MVILKENVLRLSGGFRTVGLFVNWFAVFVETVFESPFCFPYFFFFFAD